MEVITGMIMPGGWHYLQRIETDVLSVESTSYGALLNAVRQFRLDNDLPVGDVQTDVDNQICERFPHQCNMPYSGLAGPKFPVADARQIYIDKINRWAARTLNIPNRKYVYEDEAQRRAAICSSCPQNTTWQQGCPECVTKARQVLTLIRGGRGSRTFARVLGGCECLNQDNETAVWLDRSHLAEFAERTPQHCWLR